MIETFQRETIYKEIANTGWTITVVERSELDWWAAEMWQLGSTWSPVGKIAFVTFIYEPELMQEVWEVRATSEKPVDLSRDPRSSYLNLKSGWEEGLPEFIKCLAKLRDSHA